MRTKEMNSSDRRKEVRMFKNGLGFREGFRSNPVQALKKDISLVTNINAKIITALIF